MKAFPGAAGFGANATGGRQGTVIQVTNLNDSGAGSLRAALNASGPRTVIFRVGGTIALNSALGWDSPGAYVAGQTAPGDGILIKNYGINCGGDNTIIRFLRVLPGPGADPTRTLGTDTNACWIRGNGNGTLNHDVIVDHCEFGWSTDQQMDVYGNVTDVTYQNCICAEAAKWWNSQLLNPPQSISFGTLCGFNPFHGTTMRTSWLRNLYAKNGSRNPAISSDVNNFTPGFLIHQTEIVNNIVYGWGGNQGTTQLAFNVADASQNDPNAAALRAIYLQWASALGWPSNPNSAAMQVNVINNYWKRGPSTGTDTFHVYLINDFVRMHQAGGIGPVNNYSAPVDGLGIYGCRTDNNFNGVDDFVEYPNFTVANYSRATPWPFAIANPYSPLGASSLFSVLLPLVGCAQVVRNGVNTSIRTASATRIINDVLNGTGLFGGAIQTLADYQSGANFPYPTINSGTPYPDSNNDGIQDGWAGMPVGATAQQLAPNGYTYLENFLSELAGDSPAAPINTPPSTPTGVTVS